MLANGYGMPSEMVFGKKFQLPLFEHCVKTMLVDEIAQFLHRTSGSFGGFFGWLVIRIVQRYAVDNWQLDEAQRLANVDVLREEGNRLFGRKDFEGAADKYREGLTLIDQLLLREKPGDTEWTNLDCKNVPLFLNLAQCYLSLGQFYDAANCATEVLKREPDNEKALFRRAKANINKWNLDEAVTDLRRLEKSGKCSETEIVETALAEVEEKKRLKERDEKKALRAMFRGIGGVTGDQ